MNAFVLGGLTRANIEDGLVAAVAGWQILARNADLSDPPNKWVVLAKPYGIRTEWRVIGAGSGRESLPTPSSDIPSDVIWQLEGIRLPDMRI